MALLDPTYVYNIHVDSCFGRQKGSIFIIVLSDKSMRCVKV